MKIRSGIISFLSCALAATAAPASAAPTVSAGSGTTTIKFDKDFISTLESAEIRLSKVEESSLKKRTVSLPVIEGALDLADGRGEVQHSGGFRLSTESVFIRFTNLIIENQDINEKQDINETPDAVPFVTAEIIVNDSVVGRIPVFDATLPKLALPIKNGKTIEIGKIKLQLRKEAAELLNERLEDNIFQEGDQVGKSVVTLNTGRSS